MMVEIGEKRDDVYGAFPVLGGSPHTPEQQRYLEATISRALPNVRKVFERTGVCIPSDDQILEAMIMTDRFRPEQVEALMRAVRLPGLIVLPPEMQSFDDYVKFLNVNKHRRAQCDVSVSDGRKAAFAAQDTILKCQNEAPNYRFGIGEMVPEPQNRQGQLFDIISQWGNSGAARVLRSVTPREYAVLLAQSDSVIDSSGFTILSEENPPHKIIGNDGLVSCVDGNFDWQGDFRVDFREEALNLSHLTARIRPAIVA